MQSIFETLRNVLHEANIDKRVQYMVEVMFAIRKDGFKQHPAVVEELDKCEEEDQFTHALQLDDDLKGEEGLNVFKPGKKIGHFCFFDWDDYDSSNTSRRRFNFLRLTQILITWPTRTSTRR